MSTEPYAARDLTNWLLDRGARRLPDARGRRVLEVAPGRIVKIPVGELPSDMAKRIAAVVGMPYADMRAALGHPVRVSSGHRPKVIAKAQTGRTKRDVLNCSRDAHLALTAVEQAVKPGVRDSAFYERVHRHLVEAKRLIDLALSEASGTNRRSA